MVVLEYEYLIVFLGKDFMCVNLLDYDWVIIGMDFIKRDYFKVDVNYYKGCDIY